MVSPPQTQTVLHMSSAEQDTGHTMISHGRHSLSSGNAFFCFCPNTFVLTKTVTHQNLPALLPACIFQPPWLGCDHEIECEQKWCGPFLGLRKTKKKNFPRRTFPHALSSFPLTEVEATPRKTLEVGQYYYGRDWHIGSLDWLPGWKPPYRNEK